MGVIDINIVDIGVAEVNNIAVNSQQQKTSDSLNE